MKGKTRRSVVVLAVVAMIAALLAIPVAPAGAASAACDSVPSAGFTDLAGFSAETVSAVDCIAFYGITQGTSATTYGPSADVSRWQMALFLTRKLAAAGVALPTAADQGFTDIASFDAATKDAINQLAQLSITNGTSATTFDPNGIVNRWQMALFITRQLTAAGISLPTAADQGFTDISGLAQATQDAINQLAALGISKGTSATTYDPMGNVNRWQMALFLSRDLDAMGVTPSAMISVSPAAAAQQNLVLGKTTRIFTASVMFSDSVTIQLAAASDVDSAGKFVATPAAVIAGADITVVNGLAVAAGTDKTAVGSTTGSVTFTVTYTAQDAVGIFPVVYTGTGLTFAAAPSATVPQAPTNTAYAFGGNTTVLDPAAATGSQAATAVTGVNKTADYILAGGKAWFYDSNDSFFIAGIPKTYAEFEAALSTGDNIAVAPYTTTTALQSIWTLSDIAPAVPTGLAVAKVTGSTSSLKATWNAVTGADTYNIKRSAVTGGPYTTVGSVAASATPSFTDTGLSAATTYYYVVSTVEDGDESANSGQVAQTTNSVVETVPPTMVTAALTTDTTTVAFLDSGDVIDFTFSEDMANALGGSNATWLRISDGDSVYQVACADQATCVLDDLEATTYTADTNATADDHLRMTLTAAPVFVSGIDNGLDMTNTVTVTAVSAAWDDEAGNQLDLAGSADKTLS